MSPLLKKFVEEDICFASLIDLAILNKDHVDACVLGFSVWELKIVSNGFQVVSDRWNEQAHPTQHLDACNDEEQLEMHWRFVNDALDWTHISPQLMKVFNDSQKFPCSKVVKQEQCRKNYVSNLQSSRHQGCLQNTALSFQDLLEKDGKSHLSCILPFAHDSSKRREVHTCDAPLRSSGNDKKWQRVDDTV